MHVNQDPEDTNKALPQYGSKPKKPGLYLGLFHGRHKPCQVMNDWGFVGPTIGPLKWCHTTYAHHIKIEFEAAVNAIQYFGVSDGPFEMTLDADLLVFGGKYFGDWTVYYVSPDECEQPADTFRNTTRQNDLRAHRAFIL